MNTVVRRFFFATPILRYFYVTARSTYHRRRWAKAAEGYFLNFDEFQKALEIEDGKIVEIHTRDGLVFAIRRNLMDAAILGEVFLDESYLQGLQLPSRPTVLDIGGYIGDFALFAVKRLNASKVVVCEPSPRNWELLKTNVISNHFEDRVEIVNKAVTEGQDVMMNVDAPDRNQARVSGYCSDDVERKSVPGVTLACLVEDYCLETVDLLKIDCEGGEYAILSTAPVDVLNRIRNIAFEYHEIDGFKSKLNAVKQRLCDAGFSTIQRGVMISASRE